MAAAKPATKPAPVEEVAAAAPPKKSRTMLIVVLVVVLLLLIGGGVGGWWWFSHRGHDEPAGKGEHAAASKDGKDAKEAKDSKAPAAKPVFVTLDPFTVNLLEENGDHYLQMSVVYQLDDDKVGETMKTYMPVIRNRLLLLLSNKRPSEIATLDGKNKLVSELIEAVRSSIPGGTPERGVSGALLGSFVIQ
jgi:flagellar protein FliL